MKAYFTNSFKGHWSVGAQRFTCLAPDINEARAMLYKKMYDAGLKKQYSKAAEGMEEISTDETRIIDFGDGNY